jgi:L-threonylcarbamoyladenylate synthase
MADDVEATVVAIRAGQPVLLPTDTVYGLCATAARPGPVAHVYRLKGRPEGVPSALLYPDVESVLEAVPELDDRHAAVARALLPGPYTLVFPNPGRRYPWLGAEATIGIRVPALGGDAREVLQQAGPLMATSANRHGGPDPRRLEDVPQEIRDGCGAEIDGGELPGVPSTVIDLSGPEPSILREGAVPAEEALARIAAA